MRSITGKIMAFLIKIWDPNYTKVTANERKQLNKIERDMRENGTISEKDITWDI